MSIINLPDDYLVWVDTIPEVDGRFVMYGGREWELANPKELSETIRVNRDRVPFHGQLSAYIKMFVANGATSADGPRGKPFPYERLVRGVVLGSDNEDLLFTDPQDGYSVWCLVPSESENGEVEKVAKSLAVFMAGAVIDASDED